MSMFSQKLSQLIASRKVTAYQLEKKGRLSRSTITKYTSAKSKPPDKDTLEELIHMLALGTDEANELRKCFEITTVGESVYFRRSNVASFLKSMNNYIAVYPEFHRHGSVHLNKPIECIQGTVGVSNVLESILFMELNQESPHVCIIAQPVNNSDLMSYLKAIASTQPNLGIEHIICIDNNSINDDNAYNINILKEIMPLIISGISYTPYYYYDDVHSHINSFTTFPNIIITSRHVLMASHEMDRGIVSDFEDFRILHHNIFNEWKESCDTYIKSLEQVPEMITYYNKIAEGNGTVIPDFSVMPDPCLFPFLDEQMIAKYINKELPDVNAVIMLMTSRLKKYNMDMKQKAEISFCTKDGVRQFMNTGRITEFPSIYYAPLDIKDRKTVIKRLIAAMRKGTYKLNILNGSFNMQNISFACYNEYRMIYCYNHPSKGLLSFGLQERNTVHSIYDYFSVFEKQHMLLSDKETEQFIENILQDDKGI